jgi:hypothetical protein
MKRNVIFGAIFVLMVSGVLQAQSPHRIFKVAEFVPQNAVGFSVFKGTKPEPFPVRLEGVSLLGGRRFISAVISDGDTGVPLKQSGAIAGMSGSPVFVNCGQDLDKCIATGTLVGAISISWAPFPLGINAGITSAEDILPSESGSGLGAHTNNVALPLGWGQPIEFTGPDSVKKLFTENLQRGTFVASSGSTLPCGNAESAKLKAGSMIVVDLAKGDMPVGAIGTVMWRDGDKIYAFGHQFLGAGETKYPFSQISVSGVIASSFESYKLMGCRVGNEGTLNKDTPTYVAGLVGEKTAATFPLRMTFAHQGKNYVFAEDVVADTSYTNLIMATLPESWIGSIIGPNGRTWLEYSARFAARGMPEIFVKNIAYFGIFPGTKAGEKTPPPLPVLRILSGLAGSGFPYAWESVSVEAATVKDPVIWQKEKIFLSKEEALPGDTIMLTILLRRYPDGKEFRRIDIPLQVPGGKGSMRSGDISISVQAGQYLISRDSIAKPPGSLAELIKNVAKEFSLSPGMICVQMEFKPEAKTDAPAAPAQKTEMPQKEAQVKWQAITDPAQLPVTKNDERQFSLLMAPELDGVVNLSEDLTLTVALPEKPKPSEAASKKAKKHFLFF